MLNRETKDTQFLPEKVSSKVAKELYERFQEFERIYHKVFAGTFALPFVSSCLWQMLISYIIQTLLW